jgi:hypothetical protein
LSNEPTTAFTKDRFGAIVKVGTVVRVIHISVSVLDALDAQEQERVQSMLGIELPVYEVDRWGCAWVEKWWHDDEAHATSHSLGLKPIEMEVVHHART